MNLRSIYRSISTLTLSAVSLAVLCESALAENSQLITILGVEIECNNCTRLSKEQCVVDRNEGKTKLPCRDMLVESLQNLANQPKRAHHLPDHVQLIKLLTEEKRPYLLSKPTLQILLSSSKGKKTVAQQFPVIFAEYPHVIEEFISNNYEAAWLSRIAWEYEGELTPQQKALVAANHPELGIVDLLSELSTTDITRDTKDLTHFAETLKIIGSSWYYPLSLTASLLRECTVERLSLATCDQQTLTELPVSVQTYLNRMRLQQITFAIRKEGHSPMRSLELLSQSSFDTIKTNESIAIVKDSLSSLVRSEQYNRWQTIPLPVRSLATSYARSDHEIEQTLQRFKDIPQTNAVNSLRRFITKARKLSPLGLKELLYLCSILATSLFVVLVVMKSKKITSQFRDQQVKQDKELKRLRAYFQLGPKAGEDQLVKQFHRRARQLHPDTANGDTKEFAILSENYQRAKQLLRANER